MLETEMNITIIKDPRETGSYHHGTIMVGDTKVGVCKLECLRPEVMLTWDNDIGQWLIVTLLPKLEKHDDVEKWVTQQIKAGKFPVVTP